MTHAKRDALAVGTTGWRKSSFSSGNGCCVEVRTSDGMVEVRDSKCSRASSPNGSTVLRVEAMQWMSFVDQIRSSGSSNGLQGVSAIRSSDGGVIIASDGDGLRFTMVEWNAFVQGVEDGQFQPGHLEQWDDASATALAKVEALRPGPSDE